MNGAESLIRTLINGGIEVYFSNPGPKAHDMLSLDRPDLDWVKLATGMGVPARKVTTAEEFSQCLGVFLKEPGPNLIEANI